jgi:hypothetical protein
MLVLDFCYECSVLWGNDHNDICLVVKFLDGFPWVQLFSIITFCLTQSYSLYKAKASNLFAQLSESATLFKFYLGLQNSDSSKSNWSSSEILWMIFWPKFIILAYTVREICLRRWSHSNLSTLLTYLTCLFYNWSYRTLIEVILVGVVP